MKKSLKTEKQFFPPQQDESQWSSVGVISCIFELLNSFILFFIFSQVSTGRAGPQLQRHCPGDAAAADPVEITSSSPDFPQIFQIFRTRC